MRAVAKASARTLISHPVGRAVQAAACKAAEAGAIPARDSKTVDRRWLRVEGCGPEAAQHSRVDPSTINSQLSTFQLAGRARFFLPWPARFKNLSTAASSGRRRHEVVEDDLPFRSFNCGINEP